jgi:transglutaminase-like putative cysteine protease
MKLTLTLVSLTFLALRASAAAEPPSAFILNQDRAVSAGRTVTAERFPDADRVLVDNHVLEVYEKDGTSIHWDDEYSKILTEKGRRDASAYELVFDANYGTALVYRAELIKPDGRVIPIDTETYSRVMTEQGQMGSNIYDPNIKTLSFSIPGVEIGDICHLVTYQDTTKVRMPNTWSDYAVFEYNQPILKLDYDISAPPELPIRHKLLRAQITNTVAYTETKLSTGRTLHAWKVTNVPQMFPEPDMPPLHTQVQRLILSTIQDWQTVSRWYWDLCTPALEKTTPEMKAKVDELLAGATSREDKIRRLFKFVSQEIRYMGINAESTAPGYEPHDVSLTFNNRYGVCRDKAVLLAAMLTMAGIPGYPVLINASAKMDPDVPLPFFNHAITAVDKPGGGYTLMDPTDENTRDLFPAYLCNRSYLVARSEGEKLLVSDVYPAEKNLTRITTEGTLDETGALLLKSKIVFEGINDNAYRGHLLSQKDELRRKFFEGVLKNRLPGAEVLECDIVPTDLQDTETPLSVSLTTRVPDFPVRGESLDLITLPWLGTALGYANFVIGQTGLEKRRFTMETGVTCGTDERVSIQLGSSLGAIHTIPSTEVINRVGVFFNMTQCVTNTVLSGSFQYLLKTPEFSPSDYLELKNILEEIETASRKRPLFQAVEAHASDIETLLAETDTRLFSPYIWVTTNTVSKRILTYAGKKKNAELKYSFNPLRQNIELVSATVSNANGAVYHVTSKEINMMDAPWVGAAPRYPAGKTMVVNLPGVETGSVITVTTRYSATNDLFYSHTHTFGGTDPVLSETYRLTYPKALTPAVQMFQQDTVTFSAETNAATVTLTWHAPKQPVTRTEELLPPWHFFRPTLSVSFGEWRAHARALRHAIDTAMDDDTLARRRAKALVKGISDKRSRILAIRDEVLRTIRPAGPSFLDLPLDSLSSPDRTLADQYGNVADRAILLADMLDAAGFDADMLFASSDTTRYPAYSKPQRDVPNPYFFLHPIVAVKCEGATYYLNEGDQYSELGTSGLDAAPALTLSGKQTVLSVPPPYQNRSKNEWLIDLDARGTARITVSNWFFGTQVGLFRKQYSEMLPEDRRRHHLELVGAITKAAQPSAELQTDTLSYPGIRTYSLTAENYASIENSTITLLIPEVAATLFPIRGGTRSNPLFMPINDTSELICRMVLPPDYTRIKLLPKSICWTLPNGFGTLDFTVQTSMRTDGRTEVCITRRLTRNSGEAEAELYPALLEYNRLLSHPSVRTLVAEKASAQ